MEINDHIYTQIARILEKYNIDALIEIGVAPNFLDTVGISKNLFNEFCNLYLSAKNNDTLTEEEFGSFEPVYPSYGSTTAYTTIEALRTANFSSYSSYYTNARLRTSSTLQDSRFLY